MRLVALTLVAAIAALHFYIAWFEIFAWTERGPEIFTSFPADLFEPTIAMAANQGTYNAFLAAGLVWTLLIAEARWQVRIALFFLACVAVAGIVGAMTVTTRTLIIQTIPALLAMILLMMSRKKTA